MVYLICSMASSRGSTPDRAKKQVCMIVLMRAPMPVALATVERVDDVELELLLDQRFLHGPGQLVPDLVRAVTRVEQERAAGHQRP